MIMKKVMMMVAVLGLAFGAYAQEDAERRAAAEELVTVMRLKETQDQAFDLMATQMATQFKSSLPMVDAGKMSKMMEKVMGLLKEEMSWEKMKGEYIGLYAKTFTTDEMKGVIAFYKTPAGKAFLDKQPELMKQSMEIGQKAVLKITPKIQTLLMQMMTE